MKFYLCLIFFGVGIFNSLVTAQNAASLNNTNSSNQDAEIFEGMPTMPQYPGGQEGLLKYLGTIEYPREARSNNEEGTVHVRFVIDKEGYVTDCGIKKSSGSIVLDNTALNHVKKQGRWTPGYMNGEPIKTEYTVPIRFKLSSVSVSTINGDKKYNEGVIALKANDFNEAIYKFEQAYKLNKQDYDALNNLAISKYKINDTESACKIWVYLKSNELFNIKDEIENFCKTSKYKDVLNTKTLDYLTNENGLLDSLPKYPGGTEKLTAYLSNAFYPEEAIKKNYEGTAIVKAYLDTSGTITKSEILKSSGQELLDKAAIYHISKMPKWIPAIKNGNAINTTVAIKVKYFLFNNKFWQ